MKKRFLAALLVLVMAISVLPFSAAAFSIGGGHVDHKEPNDKNKTCSVDHNWLFLGNSGTCTECGKENVKCNQHEFKKNDKGATLTIEPDCINEGYVITYRICKKCGAAVGTRQFNAPVTDHDWSAKDGICGVCGTECEHETWTASVCNTCEYKCEEHVWNVDTCTVCGTVCENHEWTHGIAKSECTICDAECEHVYGTTNVCADCGYTCTHDSEDGELTATIVEATCTKNGTLKKYKVCDYCGKEYDVKTEPIRAGHTWENGKCKNCSKKCSHIPAIPSSLKPEKKTVDPTCIEDGYSVYFYDCMFCGFDIEVGRKFDSVEATGHTWVSDEEGGVCSVCEATHAHELDEGTIVTEATCIADGEGVKACQVDGCEYETTYVIPKTGHSWKIVRVGHYTYSKCENCDATCRKHTIGEDGNCTTCGKPCDHEAEGNKVQMKYVPATCTEKGYYEWYKICKHCGKKYDVTKVNGHAPATGHKWVDDQDGVSRVCRVEGCNAKCEEHTWRNGFCTNCGKRCRHPESMQTETVTKEATCEETGIKTITCACGVVVDTDEIPMEDHNFQEGVCTECGETEGCAHPANKRRERVTKYATCTRKGNIAVICLECRETIENREVDMLDHVYGWNNKCIYCWADKPVGEDPNVPGDEDQNGENADNGGNDDNNVTPPVENSCAHEHTTTYEKAATCENDGHVVVTCTDCGATVSATTVTAPGHTMEVVAGECVEATCEQPGKTVTKCTTCGYKKVDTVDKKNHAYGSDGVCTRIGCQHADESKWTLDLFGYHIVGNAGK